MKTKTINYIHFTTIESTNSWAKNNAQTLDHQSFTCITAEEQTKGHGINGRSWISPKDQNIYATLFFTIEPIFPHLKHLAQLMSFSCLKLLNSLGYPAKMKYPNDVLVDGKKIAGILCETKVIEDVGLLGIALGVGFNVNMAQEILDLIDQPATSLAALSGKTWPLEQILNPLLLQFIENLEKLESGNHDEFWMHLSSQNLLDSVKR